MRVLIVNEGIADAGGVTSYLATVAPALGRRGHEVALLDGHGLRRAVVDGIDGQLSVTDDDLGRALRDAEAWRPDVCFSHNLRSLALDDDLGRRWPAVKMMHGYFGTCIGGQKSFGAPVRRPCDRHFGYACLAAYLPRRCGRLRPATMVGEFRWARWQRRLLDTYAAVVVASEHMRREFARNGVSADKLHVVPLFAPPVTQPSMAPRGRAGRRREPCVVFLGRMTPLKGGDLLIRAVDHASRALGQRLRLVMAGDGPARPAWERLSSDLNLSVAFPGWISPAARDRLLDEATLLAVPSVWPEPFGLVGLEAAARGVPAVAFDVGGISQWLRDGYNGRVIAADPPTPQALARGLVDVLSRSSDLPRMRDAARAVAARMTLDAHLEGIETILRAARTLSGATLTCSTSVEAM